MAPLNSKNPKRGSKISKNQNCNCIARLEVSSDKKTPCESFNAIISIKNTYIFAKIIECEALIKSDIIYYLQLPVNGSL